MDEGGPGEVTRRRGLLGPAMPAARRAFLAALPGLVTGLAVATAGLTAEVVALLAWDCAALCYLMLVWLGLRRFDADATARHAVADDPSRPLTDALVLVAAVASIAAVGGLVLGAREAGRVAELGQIGLGVVSIALSWAVVHVVFMLRYARVYYGESGGIDFGSERPAYADFAYLSFTIGMTYQVSDTTLQTRRLRMTVLRHALLSFVFGTLIIATTINLVAGFAR